MYTQYASPAGRDFDLKTSFLISNNNKNYSLLIFTQNLKIDKTPLSSIACLHDYVEPIIPPN